MDFLVNLDIEKIFGNSLSITDIFSTFASCVNCGVVIASTKINKEKPFLLWNDTATALLGLGPTQINQSEWSETYSCYDPVTKELMPPDNLPLAKALAGIVVKAQVLYIQTTNSYISFNAIPLQKGSEVLGAICTFTDITENYNKEKQIVELVVIREQYKKLLGNNLNK